jgi:hypothetical protein
VIFAVGAAGPGFFSYTDRCWQERHGPRDGENPREVFSSRRDLPSKADYRARQNLSLTEESVMGIIAWIVPGPAAGPLANAHRMHR